MHKKKKSKTVKTQATFAKLLHNQNLNSVKFAVTVVEDMHMKVV